jgi:hypothetical protein
MQGSKTNFQIFFVKIYSGLSDPKKPLKKSDQKEPFFKPSPEAKSPAPSVPAYFTT